MVDNVQQLLRLKRHYSALSPTTPSLIPSSSFPTPAQLSKVSTQAWLVEHLLAASVEGETESAAAWKKVFWRRVVKGIEEGFEIRKNEGDAEVEDEEVHEAILEELVRHLSVGGASGAPGPSIRTYEWGPLLKLDEWKRVETREEGRMISQGTTGLRTWQACISLSNHLIARPSLLTTSPVLELGAGVGLLSLVAARVEPELKRIVTTDVDEAVLHQLQSNVETNALDSQVRAVKLDWELASRLPDTGSELEAWEKQHLGSRARTILGADIVYDPSLAGHLAATLAFLLRRDEGDPDSPPQAFIAGTIRNESTWELFISECRTRHLEVQKVHLETPDAGSEIVGAEGWEGEGEVRLVRIVAAELGGQAVDVR